MSCYYTGSPIAIVRVHHFNIGQDLYIHIFPFNSRQNHHSSTSRLPETTPEYEGAVTRAAAAHVGTRRLYKTRSEDVIEAYIFPSSDETHTCAHPILSSPVTEMQRLSASEDPQLMAVHGYGFPSAVASPYHFQP